MTTDVSMSRVTVLMPVYNGERYVAEAIESILSQTFSDFTLLIIDDGSTDRSAEIARGYRDDRISVISNPVNLGLIATLNRGLELIDSEFIARMDCDDIATPRRLEQQIEFLDKNPHIGMCGGYFLQVTEEDTKLARPPLRHEDISYEMIFDNVFLHSTVVFRNEMMNRFAFRYDHEYRYAEDYELWVRMSQHCRLANISDILVEYRFHPDNTSNKFRGAQEATASRIRLMHRRNLGLISTETDTVLHRELRSLHFPQNIDRLILAGDWLSRVFWVAIRRCGQSPLRILTDYNRMWYSACGRNAGFGLRALALYLARPFGILGNPIYIVKLMIRCLFKHPIA